MLTKIISYSYKKYNNLHYSLLSFYHNNDFLSSIYYIFFEEICLFCLLHDIIFLVAKPSGADNIERTAKSVGMNFSYTISSDKYAMTSIINLKNNNINLVASDSWSRNGSDNPKDHFINKIVVNSKHPMIIGQSGENSKRENGTIVYLNKIMQDICNEYNGRNPEETQKTLIKSTVKYLQNLKIEPYRERVIQYYVVYFDECSKETKNNTIEILKNTNGIFVNTYDDKYQIYSFGYLSEEFNADYRDFDFTSFTDSELLALAYQRINELIAKEETKNIPIKNRKVGGPIQWAYITNSGDINYNLI